MLTGSAPENGFPDSAGLSAEDGHGLRLDDLENGFSIFQDPKLFCFGIDAVLLAHYPRLKDGDRVADLGCGFAPIPHILCAEAEKKGYSIRVTGIEISERAAAAARMSVRYNGIEDRIRIDTGDIRTAVEKYGKQSFSLVVSNPPYMPAGGGIAAADPERDAARTERYCTLDDVVREASGLLGQGGRFAMIHRPFRLPEIMTALAKYRLTPKRMRMVYPFGDSEPSMVLLESVKGGRPFLKNDPPLFIYRKDHTYTEEILGIYGRDTVSGRDADRQS